MKKLLFLALNIIILKTATAQSKLMEQALYPGTIPNYIETVNEEQTADTDGIVRVSKISKPTLTVFLPEKTKANGTAVVICPGGGYGINAIKHEGYDVARQFNEMGVAAFVLKYRIPDPKKQNDPSIAPLQDAQQAILTVRQNAQKWNINPQQVGIMGFSAGGHLASTAGTHFAKCYVENPQNISVRPDFMILIYPVISADPAISHAGSFKNLLGSNATEEKLKDFSNELRITAQTPHTFLVHATDDNGVKSENSIVFYQGLVRNNIPAELHIYQKGGHGFGLKNATTKDLWMERCKNWLNSNGWLKN